MSSSCCHCHVPKISVFLCISPLTPLPASLLRGPSLNLLICLRIVIKHLFALLSICSALYLVLTFRLYHSLSLSLSSLLSLFLYYSLTTIKRLILWIFLHLLPPSRFVDYANKASKMKLKLNPKPNQRKVNFISISILFA